VQLGEVLAVLEAGLDEVGVNSREASANVDVCQQHAHFLLLEQDGLVVEKHFIFGLTVLVPAVHEF